MARVVPATSEARDGALVHTPDHYLGAAWPPLGRGPTRWPDIVVIGSPGADNALTELFVHLPSDARVHLAGLDDVDAALAAEVLRNTDRNLEAYQRRAIDTFIEAQRARERATLAERYTDRDPGYERFRGALLR